MTFDQKDNNILLSQINWQEFAYKNILLIGGSGFISKNLIHAFQLANNFLNLNANLFVITSKDSLCQKVNIETNYFLQLLRLCNSRRRARESIF